MNLKNTFLIILALCLAGSLYADGIKPEIRVDILNNISKSVMEYFKANPLLIDHTDPETGQTALEIAAGDNQVEIANELLKLNASLKKSILYAAHENHLEMVTLLLGKLAHFSDNTQNKILNEVDEEEKNALMLTKSPSIAQQLIDAEINLEHEDSDGKSAYDIMEEESKNKLKTSNDRNAYAKIAALITAALKQQELPLKQLAESPGETLMNANKIDEFKEYIAKSKNPDEKDSRGIPLLLKATDENKPLFAIALIARGAKVNIAAENPYWNPLMYGVYYGQLPLVMYLILKGANLNLKDIQADPAYVLALKRFNETELPEFAAIRTYILKQAKPSEKK